MNMMDEPGYLSWKVTYRVAEGAIFDSTWVHLEMAELEAAMLTRRPDVVSIEISWFSFMASPHKWYPHSTVK